MADGLATFLLMFTGDAAPALASIARVSAGLKGLSGTAAEASGGGLMGAVGGGAAALAKGVGLAATAAAAVGGIGLDMAAKFDQQMTLVRTQAGDTTDSMGALRSAILGMAGPLAQSPDELAKGLYHITSVGLRGADALDAVSASGKEATISMAPMEDVSNALAATLVAYPNYVGHAADAMANLNAIVGTGNMRFADLAGALPNVLASATAVGLKLPDVGAALADLTDRGMSADESATRLRMSFALMGAPSAAAVKALEAVGLTADESNAAFKDKQYLEQYGVHLGALSADLHKPNGLLVALEDLRSHLVASGLTAEEQSAVIFRAFGGGRTGTGVVSLYEDIDRLGGATGKYAQQAKMVGDYNNAWAATQGTLAYQTKSLGEQIHSLFIQVGERLTPVALRFVGWLSSDGIPAVERFGGWFMGTGVPALQRFGGWLRDNVLPVLEGFWHWVQERILPALSSWWGLVHDHVLPAVENLATTIRDRLLPPIGRLIDQLSPILKPALLFLAAQFLACVYIADALSMALGFVVDVVTDLISGVEWLGDHVADAFGDAVGAVKDFVTGIPGHLSDAGAKIKDFFTALPGKIGGWLKTAGEKVGEAIEKWAPIIASKLLRLSLIFATWPALVATQIILHFGDIVDAFRQGFDDVKAWVTTNVPKVADAIVSFFTALPARIKTAVEGTIAKLDEWYNDARAWVTSKVSALVNAIVQFFRDLPGRLRDAMSGAISWLVQKGSDIVSGLWNGVTTAARDVWRFFGDLPGNIGDFFMGAIHWLENAGEDVLQGLWNGLRSKWSQMTSWLGDRANDVKNFLTNPLGIHSPSRHMIQQGLYIMQGLQVGLAQGFPAVSHEMAGISSSLAAPLSGGGLGALGLVGAGARGGQGMGGTNIHVAVTNSPASAAQIAREVAWARRTKRV